MKTETDLNAEFVAAGLDKTEIELHRRRMRESAPVFAVSEPCRRDNGGIVVLDACEIPETDARQHFVAFTLAAGVASRYTRVFAEFRALLAQGEYRQAGAELARLRDVAKCWALPLKLRDAIIRSEGVTDGMLRLLESELSLPKALLPCVLEGETFLGMKIAEHRAIGRLRGEVYVIAEEHAEACADEARERGVAAEFFYQHKSTLRFCMDGSPYRDGDGRLSPVPAGHGVLPALFPRVKKNYENAHSVFIRNIDNVSGIDPAVMVMTRAFLQFHHYVLSCVQKIRIALGEEQIAIAERVARELVANVLQRKLSEGALRTVLTDLFHVSTPVAAEEWDVARLVKLYARPVNTLAQVPNNGSDVGGVAVFSGWLGRRLKICLEIPHMDDAGRELVRDCERATHFNPVFIACELEAEYPYDNPFWMPARKTFNAQRVCYHESLLSEVVGNSMYSNVVFVEMPRRVFNPHKTIADTADRHLSDWGLSSETSR